MVDNGMSIKLVKVCSMGLE